MMKNRRKSKRLFLFCLLLLFSLFFITEGCSCDPILSKETSSTDGGFHIETNFDTFECSNNCQCPSDMSCLNGKCSSQVKPTTFCCEQSNCPSGKECTDINGQTSTCKTLETCSHSCDCKQGLTCLSGKCIAIPGVEPTYCCDKEGCPSGKTCVQLRGGKSTCGEVGSPCNTACDCLAGKACVSGQCTQANKPIYCCDDAKNCPLGSACETKQGATSLCSDVSECKTACDCPIGQACNNGKCLSADAPVYCCDKPEQCPAKSECQSATGQVSVCPIQEMCKSPCDCSQSEGCVNGQCVAGTQSVYCCEKAGCPAGKGCLNAKNIVQKCASPKCINNTECGKNSCIQQGNQCTQTSPQCNNGVCQLSIQTVTGVCDLAAGSCQIKEECKNNCDCPQGSSCAKGTCVNIAGYCCEKAGCVEGASCSNRDGSSSVCKPIGCQSDAECPAPSCSQSGATCNFQTPYCDRASGKCLSTTTSFTNATCGTANGKASCVATTPPECKTHCDCKTQGQACSNGKCINSGNPVLCCDKENCSIGSTCFQKDGTQSICPKPTTCKNTAECGTPSCRQNGETCIYNQPYCYGGTCSSRDSNFPNYVCNASANYCVPKPQCQTTCDCSQGQICNNGKCYATATKAYCCSMPGCPVGSTCSNSNGSSGTCPIEPPKCSKDSDCGKDGCSNLATYECTTESSKCINGKCEVKKSITAGYCNISSGVCTPINTCKSHCDCYQGYQCNETSKGSGIQVCQYTGTLEYCCSKSGCPAGQACKEVDGTVGICPRACTSPCNCNAGEDCVQNKCTQTNEQVYCCDDTQNCPQGKKCRNKSNQESTCLTSPRSCKSACDCIQGEDCSNNVCAITTKPVYCCDKTGCPQGQACFDSKNQSKTCPQSCKETCDCPQGEYCSRGTCTSQFGKYYCCDKADCPSLNYCYKKGGGYGTCPQKACTTPCDCEQGQDCRNGLCSPVSPPVYCCEKDGCITGQSCKNKSNQWGVCATTNSCRSPCDCQQGQDCYKGQCLKVSPPVYCCSGTNCPVGQKCFDSSNKESTCAGTSCKTSCDCQQTGQSCLRGQCVYISPRIYCCSGTTCPSGQLCEDTSGTLKTCSGKACTNACDCNQGEDCRNNSCLKVSPPVYCCDNAGCARAQSCVKKDGSSSICQ